MKRTTVSHEEQLSQDLAELKSELAEAAQCMTWMLEQAPQTNDAWIKRCRAALEAAIAASKDPAEEIEPDGKHCDDYIHDFTAPPCLRFFLLIHRLPAVDMMVCREFGVKPKLFATYKDTRVRVVMASRMGDVGITRHLDAENGYQARVMIAALSNFGDVP